MKGRGVATNIVLRRLVRLVSAGLIVSGSFGCSVASGPERFMGIDESITAVDGLRAELEKFEAATRGGESTDEIVERLEALTVRFPTNADVLLANAIVALDGKQSAKAQRYLDYLLSVQPIHPEAVVLRAQLAIGEGNLPFARKTLEQQLRYRPEVPELHEVLAAIFLLEGNYSRARTSVQSAVALGAEPSRALFNLGLIEELEGNHGSARDFYQRALAARQEFVEARARLSGIEAKLALGNLP